jgi:hypothetical protein
VIEKVELQSPHWLVYSTLDPGDADGCNKKTHRVVIQESGGRILEVMRGTAGCGGAPSN